MKNNNLISISGKIGSGKDSVAKIIQYLTTPKSRNNFSLEDYLHDSSSYLFAGNDYEIKKFADKLKDIVCILLGCTRAQLEDRDFKEKILPEEWWYYRFSDGTIKPRYWYDNIEDNRICESRYLIKPSPRLLLQLIGTEAGRNIIHPNVWVNALFSDYTKSSKWIITDTRFINEINRVVKESGIRIRVEASFKRTSREWQMIKTQHIVIDPDGWDSNNYEFSWNEELISENVYNNRLKFSTIEDNPNYLGVHESEIALDNYKDWDYVIKNDGSLPELVNTIRLILTKLGFDMTR